MINNNFFTGKFSAVTRDRAHQFLSAHQPTTLNTPRRAAVAMVLHWQPKPRILLMKRASRPGDPWSGHVSFPGGRAEDGESMLQTAVRETHEELGFLLPPESRIGRLDDLQAIGAGKPLNLAISPLIFELNHLPQIRPRQSEVADTFWVDMEFFQTRSASTFDYNHHGVIRKLPCFDFEHGQQRYRIWGLTLRMLGQFFATLKATD